MGIRSQIVKLIKAVAPDVSVNKSDGVINYGKNNLFPNELIYAITDSGTATSCITKLKTFIEADGFTDPASAELKVNDDETADNLLAAAAYSVSLFGGFAFNILYALDGSIGTVYILEFEKIRKLDNGDFVYNKTLGTKNYKKSSDVIYKAFDNTVTPAERLEIINDDMQKYDYQKGEILYTYVKNPYNKYYPVPDYSAALPDIDSDGALSRLNNRNITKGFRPTVIISTVGKIDNENKDQNGRTDADYFDENLKQFTGDDASTILHLEAESVEGLPSVTQYPLAEQLNGVIESTESTANKVCRLIGVPPVLVGLKTSEGLGNTQALLNSMKLFNRFILPYQNLISSAFNKLYPFYKWNISTLNILDFIPAELLAALTQDEKRILAGYEALPATGGIAGSVSLAEKLGVGGTQALVGVLTNIDLTPAQKLESLQVLFNLSESDAKRLALGSAESVAPVPKVITEDININPNLPG